MGDFDVEPSRAISLSDAHRLISGSTATAPSRAARKIWGRLRANNWRRLARLPFRRPGTSAAILFAIWCLLPKESTVSLLLLIGAAIFGKVALDLHRKRKGTRKQ